MVIGGTTSAFCTLSIGAAAAGIDSPGTITSNAAEPRSWSVLTVPYAPRFTYDTTQSYRQGIRADRSGEDITLQAPAGRGTTSVELVAPGNWTLSMQQFEAGMSDVGYVSRKQYLFGLFPVTVGADAIAHLRLSGLRASYARTLLHTSMADFGVATSLQLIRARWSIASSNRSVLAGEHGAGSLLLPSLGIFAEYHLFPRVALVVRVEHLSAGNGAIRGAINDIRHHLEYRGSPNVSLRIGYQRQSVDFRIDDQDLKRDVALRSGGPYLGFSYRF